MSLFNKIFADVHAMCVKCEHFKESAPQSGLWYCNKGVSALWVAMNGKVCEKFSPIVEEKKVEEVPPIIDASFLFAVFGTNKQKCLFYAPLLNEYLREYEIVTENRVCAFLATIGVESGRLRYLEELASGAAYEGRKDLGNMHKGDGERYKGRGLIQITGRTNYKRVSEAFGVDFIGSPELLKEIPYCVSSSCWWWYDSGLNALADKEDLRGIRKRVNGGYNGYDDFVKLYKKCKQLWKK